MACPRNPHGAASLPKHRNARIIPRHQKTPLTAHLYRLNIPHFPRQPKPGLAGAFDLKATVAIAFQKQAIVRIFVAKFRLVAQEIAAGERILLASAIEVADGDAM